MSKSTRYGFYLIVLLCFAVRIIFVTHKSLWPDEALYLYISHNLISNPFALKDIDGSLFYLNPPCFMYILSLLLRTNILDPAVMAHLLTILMDTGTVILTFFIAKELYGSTVGLVAAALLSVNPLHWCMSTRVLNDIPLTFFVYLSVFLLMRNKKALFYLFSFFSVATKYTAAPLFLLPWINKDRITKRPWTWLIIYLLGTFAAILILSHPVTIHHDSLNYFIRFFRLPDFQEIYQESHYFLGFFVCFFFFVGLVVALKNRDFSPLLIWVLLFGTIRLFLPWMAFRISRYTLPLYPAIIIFAAYGGITSLRFFQKHFPGRMISLSIVYGVFFVYVMSISSLKGYRATYWTARNSTGFEAAQDFLNSQPKNMVILTSSARQVKYLAPKLIVYDLPSDATPKKTLAFIKEKGVNYIMLDRWSPHQPRWATEYFLPPNGYYPVLQTRNLIILKVSG